MVQRIVEIEARKVILSRPHRERLVMHLVFHLRRQTAIRGPLVSRVDNLVGQDSWALPRLSDAFDTLRRYHLWKWWPNRPHARRHWSCWRERT
jgi:hypothetical protein